MKRLLLIVLPLLFMVGCEDNNDDTTNDIDPMVGVYEMSSTSITIQSNPTQTLSFQSDGSTTYVTMVLGESGVYSFQGKIDGEDVNEGGTWSTTGNKLTLVISNTTIGDPDTEIWDYTLNGNNLVLTMNIPETDDTYGLVYTYNFTKQ